MGEPELSRTEFYHALMQLSKAVDSGFEGVNRRLDTMNGSVKRHGEAIAVLEDRGTHDRGARWGAFGNGVATAAIVLWQLLSK
jgi:hypothetical protein